METFQELFEETLKDIYYAEKAILKALPKKEGQLEEAAGRFYPASQGDRKAS